ncbi:MAG: ferrochelatase [Gammaproteobacteria bacterium]|nr:ferrochelatase [Gammaproteobacteria bacterium]MDE2250414.1 ferrochelatase [Gammaproteobacteria bacterium]
MLGVVTVNTGTPDAPQPREVSLFLRRFLADPRVVELPRLLWLPLLRGLILPLRSPRSARNYRRVWLDGGSPLAVHSQRLRQALELELEAQLPGAVALESAFLYSAPFLPEALRRLRAAGARRIVVLPLFPQSSGTTTGPVYDQVGATLRDWRALPDLRLIADYHADDAYIGALADSVREHWHQNGRTAQLLVSFHGIPQRCVDRGDPYAEQCRATAARLAAALGLGAPEWTLAFQSRFGKARWLAPATDRTLAELPGKRVRSVTVVCPGFAVDCLETLEEIAIGGRETFLHAGGEQFQYVPALNDRGDHARALARLVLANAGG